MSIDFSLFAKKSIVPSESDSEAAATGQPAIQGAARSPSAQSAKSQPSDPFAALANALDDTQDIRQVPSVSVAPKDIPKIETKSTDPFAAFLNPAKTEIVTVSPGDRPLPDDEPDPTVEFEDMMTDLRASIGDDNINNIRNSLASILVHIQVHDFLAGIITPPDIGVLVNACARSAGIAKTTSTKRASTKKRQEEFAKNAFGDILDAFKS